MRLRLFLLVIRNLWLGDFLVLYRLIFSLVVCRCLVVNRLVGLLLMMMI